MMRSNSSTWVLKQLILPYSFMLYWDQLGGLLSVTRAGRRWSSVLGGFLCWECTVYFKTCRNWVLRKRPERKKSIAQQNQEVLSNWLCICSGSSNAKLLLLKFAFQGFLTFLSSSAYVRGRDGGGMVIAFPSFFKVLGHPREIERKDFFPTLFLFVFHSCKNWVTAVKIRARD